MTSTFTINTIQPLRYHLISMARFQMTTSRFHKQCQAMKGHNKKSVSIIFIALTAITVFSLVPSSYADKIVMLKKVSDVNEESLLNTISNVSEYPKIFPDNVRYVKILDNNTKLVEMNAGINGMFFDTQAICKIDVNGNYVAEVVSGDIKGNHMSKKIASK